jgi:hypothetical protein
MMKAGGERRAAGLAEGVAIVALSMAQIFEREHRAHAVGLVAILAVGNVNAMLALSPTGKQRNKPQSMIGFLP